MGLRQLLGLQHARLLLPEPALRHAAGGRRSRATSSAPWCKALHAAGIEVLLDVVYNHTAEGDETGPTISWRGLDNASWYRLPPDRAHYENLSGCGNTLTCATRACCSWCWTACATGCRRCTSTASASTWRRCWAAATTASTAEAPSSPPAQDPVLAGVRKLIAEPWDIGPRRLPGRPVPARLAGMERQVPRHHARLLAGRRLHARRVRAAAVRLIRPLPAAPARAPAESVNYVVSHDGFTLADLVSYDLRHNEANGEGNRDGHGHNLSWNCGWEGPTDDPEVLQPARALQRALLATCCWQGTPMLAAGDELGHTQGGNNNPYCQDNPTTWIDWSAPTTTCCASPPGCWRCAAAGCRWPTAGTPACPTPAACTTWPGCAAPATRCKRRTGATA
jgi:glycogen operon protein